MFGLREKHIDRILATACQVYTKDDLSVMGWWCVLPLSCGVVYGRTMHGMANAIGGLDVRRSVTADFRGEILPENLAADLCDYLLEQVEDPVYRKAAERQAATTIARFSVEKQQMYITFFTLSIFLNSVGSADFDPIAAARTWAGGADRKWTELFFGVGVLSGSDDRPLGDSIVDTIQTVLGQPRNSLVRETLRFFSSRESQ